LAFLKNYIASCLAFSQSFAFFCAAHPFARQVFSDFNLVFATISEANFSISKGKKGRPLTPYPQVVLVVQESATRISASKAKPMLYFLKMQPSHPHSSAFYAGSPPVKVK